jgi:hypothetical protein
MGSILICKFSFKKLDLYSLYPYLISCLLLSSCNNKQILKLQVYALEKLLKKVIIKTCYQPQEVDCYFFIKCFYKVALLLYKLFNWDTSRRF